MIYVSKILYSGAQFEHIIQQSLYGTIQSTYDKDLKLRLIPAFCVHKNKKRKCHEIRAIKLHTLPVPNKLSM